MNLNLLILDTISVYPIRDKENKKSNKSNAETMSFGGFMSKMKQFQ